MKMLEKLKDLKKNDVLSSDDVFEAIFEASSQLNDKDRENSNCLEIAVRLLDAAQSKQVPEGTIQSIEFLVEECGLYPYLNVDNFSHITQTIISAHTVDLGADIRLHSKQMQMLLWLLDGDNLILSAPTSFGKTLLIDAYISIAKPKSVVMLMPTIALIDETQKRLKRTFGAEYNFITTSSDPYDPEENTIFILTQERYLSRNEYLDIDLLFVDEFYKLDPSRDDNRFEQLNLAIYRALPSAKQSFFAGPHINNIILGENWSGNFRFVKTDYRTVTVNVVNRTEEPEKLAALFEDLKTVGQESSILFTASPPSSRRLMANLLLNGFSYPTDIGVKLSAWVQDNYHVDWSIADGANSGIVIHHGKIPRSLGQLFVHLFNEEELKVLICTSTLIEGVNTSAANVFIYDKKINRTDFDFFSFANIRGRVGRMMRHLIGNVFLYYDPPEEIETNVEIPILSDPGSSTDYIVANVENDLLSEKGVERKEQLPTRTGIEFAIFKEFGGLGTEHLIHLNEKIIESLAENPDLLLWKGLPTSEQRKHLAEIVVPILLSKRSSLGLYSAGHASWMWAMLSRCKTLSAFLRFYSRTLVMEDKNETISDAVERAFVFLQACEYSFPTIISATEALVNSNTAPDSANYAFYSSSMANWFRPEWLKQLDEVGIPIPLAERLRPFLDDPDNRFIALDRISKLDLSSDESFGSIDKLLIDLATRT